MDLQTEQNVVQAIFSMGQAIEDVRSNSEEMLKIFQDMRTSLKQISNNIAHVREWTDSQRLKAI